MKENLLSLFLDIVTINLRMSRGGSFILGRNPKGCEVAERIALKVEVNTWILSTFKNEKFI